MYFQYGKAETDYLKKKAMCEYLNFKELNLHDCKAYAWGILSESHKLLMDVDWIVSWKLQNGTYRLHISPCTFVFSNVWDVNIDIVMNTTLIIDSMEIISEQVPRNISVLSKGTKEYACRINFSEGSFSFRTIDFTIIQRTKEIESTLPIFLRMREKESPYQWMELNIE